MKHLTLTLGALCIFAFASAQKVDQHNIFEQTLSNANVDELINSKFAGVEALANQRGGGDILFSEDFSNGFDGSNGNGPWTIVDNANNNAWVYVASNGAGTYYDGSATGANHPAGEFSTNIGLLDSETQDNGFMMFDCDYYNTPISDGVQDMEGNLISPVIDFSDAGSVILNWQQYFRYCCFPYAPIYVDVTNDGGTTWTTFDAHGSFIESANTASANPLPTSLDISCVAAYQPEVQIRFTYTQAPETGTAYSHYYWGIDDVLITSNPIANDLEIVQLTNGDIYNVWEYRVTPMEQKIAAADGGVIAGVLYRNNGTENQENVDIVIDILDESGATVLNTVVETLDIAYSFANALDCPANSQDTVYISTNWEPTEIGNYILRATIDAGNEDATPEDNVSSKVIVFTDDEYGHDDEGDLTNEVFPRESEAVPGYYDPTGQGCFYHMVNGGSTAYGINVSFGDNAGLSQGGAVAEIEFEARIYTYDPSVGVTDSDYESTFFTFLPAWNGTTQYLEFDDPVDLEQGTAYFVGVIAEYENEGALTVNVQPNSDTDFSTGQYSQTGDGDFVWFVSQTYTPAIRLILSERGCLDDEACNYNADAAIDAGNCIYVGDSCNDNDSNTFDDIIQEDCDCEGTVNVEEIFSSNGVTLFQNTPNPVTSITTFSFELNTSRDIQFEIRDMRGRIITNMDKGTMAAGIHSIDFDIEGLSGGMYTYTLTADGVSLTKKMTVK